MKKKIFFTIKSLLLEQTKKLWFKISVSRFRLQGPMVEEEHLSDHFCPYLQAALSSTWSHHLLPFHLHPKLVTSERAEKSSVS